MDDARWVLGVVLGSLSFYAIPTAVRISSFWAWERWDPLGVHLCAMVIEPALASILTVLFLIIGTATRWKRPWRVYLVLALPWTLLAVLQFSV